MSLVESDFSPAIYEPIPIQDTFLTGIDVEDCGDFLRVVGFTDRHVHGATERTIVLRAVLTRLNFSAAVDKALKMMMAAAH